MANLQNPKELESALRRARIGIIIFIFTFFFLILLGLAVVASFSAIGLILVSYEINKLTLILAVALFSVSILMTMLLFKFLASHTRHSREGLYEVTAKSEPTLFALITEISQKVGTSMPKHVYLSNDVNAAVFFDSSLLSLILPAKKNLIIGLSLVNMTKKDELKAIVAHEFGHFAQKSMKVGSYVYHANLVIANVLFANEKDNRASDILENLGFAGGLAIAAMGVIKYFYDGILKWVYNLINIQNMELSREMEFQADSIAAEVSNGQALAHALMRLDICSAASSYVKSHFASHTTSFTENIFQFERIVLDRLAEKSRIPMQDSLPEIDRELFRNLSPGNVKVDSKWSSHPPTLSRVERLAEKEIGTEQDPRSAWEYFQNPTEIQKEFSQKFFKTISDKARKVEELPAEFTEKVHSQIPVFIPPLDCVYNEVLPGPVQADNLDKEMTPSHASLESLFSSETASSIKQLSALRHDLEVLNAIHNNQDAVKTFQLQDRQYTPAQASGLAKELEHQIKLLEDKLSGFDESAFHCFVDLAEDEEARLAVREAAGRQSEIAKRVETNGDLLNKVIEESMFFYRNVTMIEKKNGLRNLAVAEKAWQTELKKLLDDEQLYPRPTQDEFKMMKEYCMGPLVYDAGESYHISNIHKLQSVTSTVAQWLQSLNYHASIQLVRNYEQVLMEQKKAKGK